MCVFLGGVWEGLYADLGAEWLPKSRHLGIILETFWMSLDFMKNDARPVARHPALRRGPLRVGHVDVVDPAAPGAAAESQQICYPIASRAQGVSCLPAAPAAAPCCRGGGSRRGEAVWLLVSCTAPGRMLTMSNYFFSPGGVHDRFTKGAPLKTRIPEI